MDAKAKTHKYSDRTIASITPCTKNINHGQIKQSIILSHCYEPIDSRTPHLYTVTTIIPVANNTISPSSNPNAPDKKHITKPNMTKLKLLHSAQSR